MLRSQHPSQHLVLSALLVSVTPLHIQCYLTVFFICISLMTKDDFLGGSDGKATVYNAGDVGSIPGLGRSPGEGNGNPLQDYCLENPMDREAW